MEKMNEGIKLHPRHKIRVLAEVDHSTDLLKTIQKYDLTYGEIFTMLSKSILSWAGHLKHHEDNEIERKQK